MNENRQQKLASFASAYDQLKAALAEIPSEIWSRDVEEGWNIHEILIHLADAETHGYIRLRFLIAQSGKEVVPYDQDAWKAALYYDEQDSEAALQLFRLLRELSYKLILKLPESVWSNTIYHPEHGVMTLDDWLESYEDHGRQHVAQIRAVHAGLQK